MRKTNTNRVIGFLLVCSLCGGSFGVSARVAFGQTTNANGNTNVVTTVNTNQSTTTSTGTSDQALIDLQNQIAAKQKELDTLKQQQASYQQLVDHAAGEVKDIQSQVSLIDTQLSQMAFAIQTKQEEISTIQLQVDALQREIDDRAQQMNDQKSHLADALKELDANSRVSTLALLLTHQTLSDYYSQSEAVASISSSLQDSLASLARLKAELQSKQDEATKQKDDLQQAQVQLQVQQQSTQDQKDLKQQLLQGAQTNTTQYQQMLQSAQLQEQQADSTISALEKQIQAKQSGGAANLQFSSTGFIWPVLGKITATFHDPTYPFDCRNWKNVNCQAHDAVDISVPQGTPVKAAADGVVSAVSDQGFYYNSAGQKTNSALNFVGIIHGNGLSTRYLHLTVIYVKPDQIVHQGDIIGLSGGLPGTAGAGGMTTGAHLHFEVRVNGLPDDPLKYLPQ